MNRGQQAQAGLGRHEWRLSWLVTQIGQQLTLRVGERVEGAVVAREMPLGCGSGRGVDGGMVLAGVAGPGPMPTSAMDGPAHDDRKMLTTLTSTRGAWLPPPGSVASGGVVCLTGA